MKCDVDKCGAKATPRTITATIDGEVVDVTECHYCNNHAALVKLTFEKNPRIKVFFKQATAA